MYSFPESGISLIKQIGGRHPSTRVIIIIQNGLHKTFHLALRWFDWMCWSYVLVKCKVHLPRPKKMPCCSCNPWPLIADCMGSLMILHWILLPYDWSSMPENVFTPRNSKNYGMKALEDDFSLQLRSMICHVSPRSTTHELGAVNLMISDFRTGSMFMASC